MMFAGICLAESGWLANLVRYISSTVSPTVQFSIFFGAAFLLIIGIFAWAAFYRKPGSGSHRHHRHHRHHRQDLPPLTARPGQPPPGQVPSGRRRRRRRRRHSDLPRNPTLAETGGLPPRRTDETPPPASPL